MLSTREILLHTTILCVTLAFIFSWPRLTEWWPRSPHGNQWAVLMYALGVLIPQMFWSAGLCLVGWWTNRRAGCVDVQLSLRRRRQEDR